jgi:hypothetical protein
MSSVTPAHDNADDGRYQAPIFGMVAEFASPYDLLEGVKAVRAAGFSNIDTHTPFPIHGMDQAMGLAPSKLPWFVLFGGLTGTTCAVTLQWWMNAFDYPFRIGGKPIFSYQAYVPIGFELTVLLSAITTVLGMLALCRLPRPYHALFTHDRFGRFSDDGFFLSIEASDSQWSQAKAEAALQKAGGQHITIIRDSAES